MIYKNNNTMKHIKLFESFVNEELTKGTKLSQALLLHVGKQPEEKGPEMDKWKEDKKVYEKALKDHLEKYDIDVYFSPSSFDKSLTLTMYFPESFMSKVKKFFGFGKNKISLSYCVENLTDVTDTTDFAVDPYMNWLQSDYDQRGPEPKGKGAESYIKTIKTDYISSGRMKEKVSMLIGVDRKNTPKFGNDISNIDTNRKQNEFIELDREDAMTMCKILQDINPASNFRTPKQLVDALNMDLEGSFKSDVERSQTDAGYKFVVLNQITLV